MTARNKLLTFLSTNADMLTPSQAARVEAMREPAGPAKVVGSVSTGCLSALDCQSLLCRWTARAEMFRGAWKICRFRAGGPDHAGMLKYDYAATALEAAIREMREQMEAAPEPQAQSARCALDALLAAVVQWSEARKMRCLSCDEGQESAPCTCFDGVAAIDAAEKKLQEIADEAANIAMSQPGGQS